MKFFSKHDFQFVRQKGSHIVLRRLKKPHTILVIPNHNELDRGTLKSIIIDSGLSINEFIEQYNK